MTILETTPLGERRLVEVNQSLSRAEERIIALERHWGIICPEVSTLPSTLPPDYRTMLRALVERQAAEEYAPIAVPWMRRQIEQHKREEAAEAEAVAGRNGFARARPALAAAVVMPGASVLVPRVLEHFTAVAPLTG